ncbi:MAG: hypothetical protein HRT44_10685, partial [Bdellovibrionales bacterium]|nr:hypothetical protein [Bdellovibrionales bacterium]NQZ19707.1 hypothetical protein [Bdellovibrionales bacterium]
MKKINVLFVSLLTLFMLSSCGSSDGGSSSSASNNIRAYCESVTSYSDAVTITGSADYEYRVNGNGAVSSTNNPIRYAEIVVTNSGGSIIQCGETDAAGNFSLSLPNDGSD